MIIAKQQHQEINNDYYELFQPAKAIGMDWEEIDVMQSIGSYSIEQLNQEKANYLNMIASVDEKLDAINSIIEAE